MTPEQRRKASIDLTLTYFGTYYVEWRLAKILTIKKLVEDRHSFYENIITEIRGCYDQSGSPTIAQEIHNGLHHDAIAQCVQYIEDLFALIHASKKPDFFVREIISYKAGKIIDNVKNYKANAKNIRRDFFIPDISYHDESNKQKIEDSIDYLAELMDAQITFYKKYWFFYNQYKHGLAIPMRLTECFNTEQVDLDIKGEMPPFVVVYDNINIKSASSKGIFDPKHGMMLHGFTENVRPFFSQLEKENNFLRMVSTPDFPEFNIDLLIDQARKTRACINTFISNYSRHISPEPDAIRFQIPADYIKNESFVCTVPILSN